MILEQKNNEHEPIIINNEEVERVTEYKYLGVIFDENLEWHSHSDKVRKKVNQRMFFLRKLNYIHLDISLLILFYQSCVLSTMSFCLTAWGGNIRAKDRQEIDRSLKGAGKVLGPTHVDTTEGMYISLIKKKLTNIMLDSTHPLFNQIVFSVRSGRVIHLKSRTNRYMNSFLPSAIRNL